MEQEAGAGLSAIGIRKGFGGRPVLHGVDLAVAAGEFVTLLGPSGCGKTTLLRILAGLELPDAGAVRLGGREITNTPAHRRPVNTVFQSYALFPHLSAFDNVAFGLRSRKVPPAEVRRRTGEALELLRLPELADRKPDQLSGGQRQRVALARALVNEPELLLLDEPMSALDAKLRGELQLELRRLQRRLGTMFLLVTHDQDEAMTVSDRILVMSGGRVEQEGPPAEVYERPRNRFVATFLGNANLIAATAAGGARAETAVGPLVLRAPLPGPAATLSIRPERVAVANGAAAENAIVVRIAEIVYRGDHADVLVEPGPLRLRLPPPAPGAVGDEIRIVLPKDHIEALDD